MVDGVHVHTHFNTFECFYYLNMCWERDSKACMYFSKPECPERRALTIMLSFYRLAYIPNQLNWFLPPPTVSRLACVCCDALQFNFWSFCSCHCFSAVGWVQCVVGPVWLLVDCKLLLEDRFVSKNRSDLELVCRDRMTLVQMHCSTYWILSGQVGPLPSSSLRESCI